MASDQLREAIEGALPVCERCLPLLDVLGSTLCSHCFFHSIARPRVEAAVAPLLAAVEMLVEEHDAALAASDGEEDGPEETPTANGPQEAAHRMEQARRLK